MKKKLNIILLSLLAILISVLPFKALDAEENANARYQEIIIKWNHYDLDKGYYNPADKGKEVKMNLYLVFDGHDENGDLRQNLYYKYIIPYTAKIGEEKHAKIPVDKMVATNGKTYTDCQLTSLKVAPDKDNHIYGFSGWHSSAEGRLLAQFDQNMNFSVEAKIAQGSAIRDEDKGNMKISFKVRRTKDGKVDWPYENDKQGVIYENIVDFKEGQLDLWKDDYSNDGSFARGLEQNDFGMFNPYSGRYKTYELIPEFTGDNKDELNKKYSLNMTGNDLDGWNLELVSNFKVTFDSDNGQAMQNQYVKANEKVEKPQQEPTKEDHKFLGWFTDAGEEFKFDKPITSDLKLKAKWEKLEDDKKVEKVKLTFTLNGGKWSDGSSEDKVLTVDKGSVVDILEAPMKEGYKFEYWKGSEYQPGDKYTAEEDHTFVAQWKKVAKAGSETAPEAPSQSEKSAESSKANDNKAAGNKTTKTGDTSYIAMTVGVISLVVATALVMNRKKDEK